MAARDKISLGDHFGSALGTGDLALPSDFEHLGGWVIFGTPESSRKILGPLNEANDRAMDGWAALHHIKFLQKNGHPTARLFRDEDREAVRAAVVQGERNEAARLLIGGPNPDDARYWGEETYGVEHPGVMQTHWLGGGQKGGSAATHMGGSKNTYARAVQDVPDALFVHFSR